ncbi:MAG: hypothetical protein ABI208_02970 [Ginsengibacter sp.]|jgi:hypothetical protein
MEDIELKELLATYQQRLEVTEDLNRQSRDFNKKIFENLQSQKADSKLKSLISIKTIAVILGIAWVIVLGYLISHSWEMKNIFFIISAIGVAITTIIAIAVYIYHIVLLKQINQGDSVLKTQDTITRLKLSTLQITRILFLQSTFYCTFWWNTEMIAHEPMKFWFISFPVALLFFLASLWLYKNISLKNVHKKWFKILFSSPEWCHLTKAAAFLKEIQDFDR